MRHGNETNPIVKALKDTHDSQDQAMQETAPKDLTDALRLFNGTVDVVCRRFGDPNILPFLHVTLVFLHHLTFYPDAMAHVAPSFPWKLAALMLNTLMGSCDPKTRDRVEEGEAEHFSLSVSSSSSALDETEPTPDAATQRPLPDDYALRGFPWVERYFPEGWFANDKIDDDEKYFEVPSMMEERKERALWLGCRIAKRGAGRWLSYDKQAHLFGVSSEFEVGLELDLPATPASVVEGIDYGELPDAMATGA
jgi:hypothetical protein